MVFCRTVFLPPKLNGEKSCAITRISYLYQVMSENITLTQIREFADKQEAGASFDAESGLT